MNINEEAPISTNIHQKTPTILINTNKVQQTPTTPTNTNKYQQTPTTNNKHQQVRMNMKEH